MGIFSRENFRNQGPTAADVDAANIAKLRAMTPGAFAPPPPPRVKALRKPKPAVPIAPPPRIARWLGPVLAVDPSIAACGWAVLDRDARGIPARVASGTWHPSAARDAPDRWVQLRRFVTGLVAQHRPAYAVVEQPNRVKIAREGKFSRKSQIVYGRAVGIVEASLWFAMNDENVWVPDVQQWKGTGRKVDTQALVSARLRYTPGDHNEADALGIATWFTDVTRPQ